MGLLALSPPAHRQRLAASGPVRHPCQATVMPAGVIYTCRFFAVGQTVLQASKVDSMPLPQPYSRSRRLYLCHAATRPALTGPCCLLADARCLADISFLQGMAGRMCINFNGCKYVGTPITPDFFRRAFQVGC